MKLPRRRRHDDHLAHMANLAGQVVYWQHRAESAEAKLATQRKIAGQYQAIGRLRDLAADRANRSAAS